MKTSDSKRNGRRCPQCNTPTTIDWKHRGFVRHKRKPPSESACAITPYGLREKDGKDSALTLALFPAYQFAVYADGLSEEECIHVLAHAIRILQQTADPVT
jgi:hypothetical protein